MVRDAQGRPVNYIEIFSDITERKEREERVRHLAHHDALTDLPNRALLNDRIAQAVSLAERNRTRVAVMFLDLDRFKTVNDSLGHSVGDKLLREVSSRLQSCMRASDTVSRLGGDEFVILMPNVTDPEDVAVTARKVLDAVAHPYSIDGHELVSTPSIGISVYPGDGADVDTLLRNADAAMYHAKETGPQQLPVLHPGHERAGARAPVPGAQPAARAGARRAAPALPASVQDRGRSDGRPGGADPLAASGAGAGAASSHSSRSPRRAV